MSRSSPPSGRCIWNIFDSEAAIAEAKAEIFEGLEPGGTAIVNRDNQWFDLLAERARAHGARVLSFGEHASADVRLERVALQEDGSSVAAEIAGAPVTYRLGAPGRHLVAELARRRSAPATRIGADMRARRAGACRVPRAEGARASGCACAIPPAPSR